jgi:hypothetical protein
MIGSVNDSILQVAVCNDHDFFSALLGIIKVNSTELKEMQQSSAPKNHLLMSAAENLAGVIGTWVGAGIGLLALIGIVGPVLIWLASRTERQKTLNAIGRDNNKYLSAGWHLGPNIYLGQRIRAPMLRKPKTFVAEPLALDQTSLKDFNAKATWVSFGALLTSYGIEFSVGDDLEIKQTKAYLPMHPSWVLMVGLLGRYSNRDDRGRRRTRNGPVFRAQPSSGYGRKSGKANVSRLPPPSPRPGRIVEDGVYDEDEDNAWAFSTLETTLYGITGSLRFPNQIDKKSTVETYFPVLYFQILPVLDLQTIEKDVLSPRQLFLLAIGYLHINKDRYVSLNDTSRIGSISDSEGDDDSNNQVVHHSHRMPDNAHPFTHLRYDHRAEIRRDRLNDSEALFQLDVIEADELVEDLGKSFLGDLKIDFSGLVPVTDRALIDVVNRISGNTYVPAESDWIRVHDSFPEAYIRRTDAQQLALALLSFPWHPEGYLVGGNRRSVGMSLLTLPAKRLRPMMTRVRMGIDLLSLNQRDKQNLRAALDLLMRLHDRKVLQSRHGVGAMYRLDKVLSELCGQDNQIIVERVIGILAITNNEFSELVQQSLRNIEETSSSNISLDLRSTTLKVPSAFGVVQHFIVDWDQISSGQPRPFQTVPVSYTVVVLASLRSLLRCMMLKESLEADPLLNMAESWKDVVYMC